MKNTQWVGLMSAAGLCVISSSPSFAAEKSDKTSDFNKPFLSVLSNWKQAAAKPIIAKTPLIIQKIKAASKPNTLSSRSAYEWINLVPNPTHPGDRTDYAMAYDDVRNLIYMFGGESGSFPGDNNDLWVFSPATDHWEKIAATGEMPHPRSSCKMVYDSTQNALYLFGGSYFEDGHTSVLNDLWRYDLTANAWDLMVPQSSLVPPRRIGAYVFALNQANQEIILFGGQSAGSATLNDKIWIYSLSSRTWLDLAAQFPGGTNLSSFGCTYDRQQNRAYLFGGATRACKNELWELDCNSLQWTLRSDTAPIMRRGPATAFNENENRFYSFGGLATNGQMQNDIYYYDLTADQWHECQPGPEEPSPRADLSMCYLPGSNEMFIYGGGDGAFPLCDEWYFSGLSQQWSRIDTAPNSPAPYRSGANVIYNSINGKYYLFGGRVRIEYTNDLWEYNANEQGWTKVAVTGDLPDPPRGEMSAVYDPVNNQMLLFGGFRVYYGFIMVTNATYAIDLNEENNFTCRKISAGNTLPSGRSEAAAIYHPLRHSMVIYGGYSLTTGYNDLWEFDIASRTWHELNAAVRPSVRSGCSMVFNDSTAELLLFGGYDMGYRNDLWKYSFSGQDWREVPMSGNWPEPRAGCGYAYDSVRNKMMIYGGTYGYSGIMALLYNEVWSYDVASSQWANLPLAGEHVFRKSPQCIFDPKNNDFVVCDGYRDDMRFDDTQALSIPAADFVCGVNLNQGCYFPGDHFVLTVNVQNNTPAARNVDLYLALNIMDCYWFFPSWCAYPPAIDFATVNLPAHSNTSSVVLNFIWPSGFGALYGLNFLGGIVDHQTQQLLSYAEVSFSYGARK